jgi:hypothetical protein
MTTTQFSLAATEQLRHYLFVRERTGPTSCHPLIMLLQHGVGFRGVEVISRGTLFQRPQSPVLIDRDHHRGRAAATSPSATPRRRRGSSPPARRRPRTACWPGVVNGSPTRRRCSTGRGFGPSTRLFPGWRPIRSSSPGPLTRRRGYWACRLRRTAGEEHLPVPKARTLVRGRRTVGTHASTDHFRQHPGSAPASSSSRPA